MSSVFFELGRRLGRVAVPALRKSKWLWKSLTGTEAEALQAEAELGRALAAELRLRLGPVLTTPEAQLLADICRRLRAHLPDRRRQFQAELVRLDSPSALALPGGYIFVDAGLVELCQRDADELAFVLGHEMAHISSRHVLERLIAQVGLEVLGRLLSRGAAGQWLRQTGLALLRSAYSQRCETEADVQGLRLARAAGYDSAGAFRLLERLGRLRQSPAGLAPYFASHPTETVRIARLRAALGCSGA